MRLVGGGRGLAVLLSALALGFSGFRCRSTASPDRPATLYDFAITYQRPVIVKPENRDPTELVIVVKGAKTSFPLTKVTDYLFTAEVKGLPVTPDADPPDAVYVIDPRRFDSESLVGPYDYGRPHSVGDIFVFKSVQTAVEKQLVDIVPNTYLWGLPAKCFPRMARFRVLRDGSID